MSTLGNQIAVRRRGPFALVVTSCIAGFACGFILSLLVSSYTLYVCTQGY